MELQEFYQMELSELLQFQEANRAKMAEKKQKAEAAKASIGRYIKRGKIATELVPGAELERMDEDTFAEALRRLIYEK